MALFGFGKKKSEEKKDDAPRAAIGEEAAPRPRFVPLAPGGEVPVVEVPNASAPAPDGWAARLAYGFRKTSSALSENMADIFLRKKLDADSLNALEDALILTDMGPKAAALIRQKLADAKLEGEGTEEAARKVMADEIFRIVAPKQREFLLDGSKKPYVILFSGVNGSGKTTTIGKIAAFARKQGLNVIVGACDTFRAAAVEQLDVWADRAGAEIVKGAHGADPASVAYRAMERAREAHADLALIDTAGRLQNKNHLMDELQKTRRALQKIDPSAPHDSVIVVDGTTGGNAMAQIEKFKDAAALTGICVTKLDGTAKGGIVIRAAQECDLPVYAVGVGEKEDDLRAFRARAFADSLAGLSS
ncbi:MAG: signal recognition particle-docking protein FtsY [Rickettsiales bacterium]